MIFAFSLADSLIFPAPSPSYKDTSEIVKLRTANQETISALYLPNPHAQFTILYSHGNGEDIGYIRFILDLLVANGFSVLAYDYQGYGTSSGKPSEENVYHDIDAAYQHLTTVLQVQPKQIIAYGRSLGSGAAIDLASRHSLAGVILEAGFLSAFRIITQVPLMPFDKFKNIDKISKVRCPLLLIHGKEDMIVPFWHGKALWEAANPPKSHLWLDKAGHNDIVWVGGETYWGTVRRFAKSITE